MPVFRGKRTQRGRGRIKKFLKRYAVPLVNSGVRAAAPHAKKLAGNVATSVAKKAFANHPAMQEVVGHLASHVTNKAIQAIQKKQTRRTPVRPVKRSQEKEPNDSLTQNGKHRR